VRYFGDSGQLQKKTNDWWIYDQYNDARIAKGASGAASWWWLRSPGYSSLDAAAVLDDGGVYMGGYRVGSAGGGVRPALWLNL